MIHMIHAENLIHQLSLQLHHWRGSHSLFALAAVLAVYVLIVFQRRETRF